MSEGKVLTSAKVGELLPEEVPQMSRTLFTGDVDTLTQTGDFMCINTCTNTPVRSYGMMRVRNYRGDFIYQEFIPHVCAAIYHRNYHHPEKKWFPWMKVVLTAVTTA